MDFIWALGQCYSQVAHFGIALPSIMFISLLLECCTCCEPEERFLPLSTLKSNVGHSTSEKTIVAFGRVPLDFPPTVPSVNTSLELSKLNYTREWVLQKKTKAIKEKFSGKFGVSTLTNYNWSAAAAWIFQNGVKKLRANSCPLEKECTLYQVIGRCGHYEFRTPGFKSIRKYLTKFPKSDRNSVNNCDHAQFLCQYSGECVRRNYVCDDEEDCRDGTDEETMLCEHHHRPTKKRRACEQDEFQCVTTECIPGYQICDAYPDCADGSDEFGPNCSYTGEDVLCPTNHTECTGGACIQDHLVCNGNDDCGDNSDELNCSTPLPNTNPGFRSCRDKEFQCNNGKCIKRRYVCDKNRDCDDGSDELHCSGNRPAEFADYNGKAFVADEGNSFFKKLFGIVNRASGAMIAILGCSAVERACENGKCISSKWFCDGDYDCEDRSDEAGCTQATTTTTTTTTPKPNLKSITKNLPGRAEMLPSFSKGYWRPKRLMNNSFPLVGGRDVSNESNYICKRNLGKQTIPGKMVYNKWLKATVCYVVLQGIESRSGPEEEYIFLDNPSGERVYSWIDGSMGSISDGAMQGGMSPEYEPYFICRIYIIKDKDVLVTGMLQLSLGYCMVPWNWTFLIGQEYQVLHDVSCKPNEDEFECAGRRKATSDRSDCKQGIRRAVPKTYVFDGHKDCFDGCDEINCSNEYTNALRNVLPSTVESFFWTKGYWAPKSKLTNEHVLPTGQNNDDRERIYFCRYLKNPGALELGNLVYKDLIDDLHCSYYNRTENKEVDLARTIKFEVLLDEGFGRFYWSRPLDSSFLDGAVIAGMDAGYELMFICRIQFHLGSRWGVLRYKSKECSPLSNVESLKGSSSFSEVLRHF